MAKAASKRGGGDTGDIDIGSLSSEQLQGLMKQVEQVSLQPPLPKHGKPGDCPARSNDCTMIWRCRRFRG